MLRIEGALEGPQHIIGIQAPGRLEVVGGMEFHAGAQVEGIAQSVGADVPALGQPRDHLGGAGAEGEQAVEHGFRGGVGGHRAGVLDDVEAFRAGLGADHQVLRLGRAGGA